MPHLTLDAGLVNEARAAASRIAHPVLDFLAGHTTIAIERTVLRLIGVDGVDSGEVPLPNVVVDRARALLPGGILAPFAAAMLQTGLEVQPLAEAIAAGEVQLEAVPAPLPAEVCALAERLAYAGVQRIRARRRERAELLALRGNPPQLWIYVIVATGNIYEDIVQAKAAARQGADIIAVIRSTAQSLLDYVPYGATTEGFGGTYATQENFRLKRAASLDSHWLSNKAFLTAAAFLQKGGSTSGEPPVYQNACPSVNAPGC